MGSRGRGGGGGPGSIGGLGRELVSFEGEEKGGLTPHPVGTRKWRRTRGGEQSRPGVFELSSTKGSLAASFLLSVFL